MSEQKYACPNCDQPLPEGRLTAAALAQCERALAAALRRESECRTQAAAAYDEGSQCRGEES